jgi:hypothetical protein
VNREQMGERRRKRAWWRGALAGLVAAPLINCSGLCLRPIWAPAWPELASHLNPSESDFDPPPAPFDQRRWERAYSTDRIAMGKWMEANGTLIGMSREEVLAMLGEPEIEYKEDDGGRQLRWHLGERPSPMFLSWILTLIVDVDHTGKVTKAWVYWHD